MKVLDFGLAKISEDVVQAGNLENSPTLTFEPATRAGTVLGTAAYMAPEQARGKRVDKRADIWAYGVVLYEMVTGWRLFNAGTVSDTLAAVFTKEPEWARVPPGTERLLRRCLKKDPKHRLRDIGDARFLLEGDIEEATPAPRNNWLWKLSTAALAIVSLAALVFVWQSSRHAVPAILRLNVDFGADADLEPRRGVPMALSPDGSQIVFVIGQQMINSRLAVRRLEQSRVLPLTGTEGAEAPFFPPDGKSIGFFADGKLKKIDSGGGPPFTLCDAPRERGANWGDDQNIVFAGNNMDGLWRVPASGGVPQEVTKLDRQRGEVTHRYPQVLPGGEAVLFMNGVDSTGEGRIEAQSLLLPRAGSEGTEIGHAILAFGPANSLLNQADNAPFAFAVSRVTGEKELQSCMRSLSYVPLKSYLGIEST